MPWNAYAGWGEETTWGSAVTRTGFSRIYEGSGTDQELPKDPLDVIGTRDPAWMVDGIGKATGTLIVPACYEGLGLLLKHSFGAVADAGAGPTYTHTFTMPELCPPATGGAGGSKPSLTIEQGTVLPETNKESVFAYGCCIDTMSFEAKPGQQLRLNVGYVGKSSLIAAATPAPTFIDYSTHLVIPQNITMTIAGSAASVTSVSIDVKNNLDSSDAYLGSASILQPMAGGQREVSGVIEKYWENETEYAKFLAGTSVALVITATRTISGNVHSWVFTLNNCLYTGETPKPTVKGRQPQRLPFRALYDVTHTAMKLVETNTVATT